MGLMITMESAALFTAPMGGRGSASVLPPFPRMPRLSFSKRSRVVPFEPFLRFPHLTLSPFYIIPTSRSSLLNSPLVRVPLQVSLDTTTGNPVGGWPFEELLRVRVRLRNRRRCV